MTTVEDLLYKDNLRGKKYMMCVSPWFYTSGFSLQVVSLPVTADQVQDLPQWNKNWYCSSESLWYDRWQQILEVMPDFVQIITCRPCQT
jgi:glucan endo-1,3-alpha-glucosidase